MTCPDVGLWRAWLDGEAADPEPALADHLTTCAICQRRIGELRQAAAGAAAAVAFLAPAAALSPASLALARERLLAARASSRTEQTQTEEPLVTVTSPLTR